MEIYHPESCFRHGKSRKDGFEQVESQVFVLEQAYSEFWMNMSTDK